MESHRFVSETGSLPAGFPGRNDSQAAADLREHLGLGHRWGGAGAQRREVGSRGAVLKPRTEDTHITAGQDMSNCQNWQRSTLGWGRACVVPE